MRKEISKFLSYVLRHAPESIGLKLDANGWVPVRDLLAKAKKGASQCGGAHYELFQLAFVQFLEPSPRYSLIFGR